MFLNEQKVSLVSKAAVLADEFVLTHKMCLHLPCALTGLLLKVQELMLTAND